MRPWDPRKPNALPPAAEIVPLPPIVAAQVGVFFPRIGSAEKLDHTPPLGGGPLHPGVLDAHLFYKDGDLLAKPVVLLLEADACVPVVGGPATSGAMKASEKEISLEPVSGVA